MPCVPSLYTLLQTLANNTQWMFGVIPSFPGFLSSVSPGIQVPIGFTNLYYLCFLSGSTIAGFVYAVLHYVFPDQLLNTFVQDSLSSADLMAKYQEKWDSRHGMIIVGEVKNGSEIRATDIGKV